MEQVYNLPGSYTYGRIERQGKEENDMELQKTGFNFAIKESTVISIITIVMMIVFGYIMIFYMRDLDIVSNSEAKGHINNTTDQWVLLVGILFFAIVMGILFAVLAVLRKKGK